MIKWSTLFIELAVAAAIGGAVWLGFHSFHQSTPRHPTIEPVAAPVTDADSTTFVNNSAAPVEAPAPPKVTASPTPTHPRPIRTRRMIRTHRHAGSRFQSRNGACAHIPAAAYSASPSAITAYMQAAGYTSMQISQVLACVGK